MQRVKSRTRVDKPPEGPGLIVASETCSFQNGLAISHFKDEFSTYLLR
jgi:hypothetical protein